MYRFFCRQLGFYARYHRDPRNCATHYLGIPMLFLAAILPLQASRIAVGSFQLPLAVVLVLPAVMGWMVLDLGVGAALCCCCFVRCSPPPNSLSMPAARY